MHYHFKISKQNVIVTFSSNIKKSTPIWSNASQLRVLETKSLAF